MQREEQPVSPTRKRWLYYPRIGHYTQWLSSTAPSTCVQRADNNNQAEHQPQLPPPPKSPSVVEKLELLPELSRSAALLAPPTTSDPGAAAASQDSDDIRNPELPYPQQPQSPQPYRGPDVTPSPQFVRFCDPQGPVEFVTPPLCGGRHVRAELRPWPSAAEALISQNSSKRVVTRGLWLSPLSPELALPVAVKYVEDWNSRDGRSIKREIECHLFINQRLGDLVKHDGYRSASDAWPSAELLGYHLDKKNPGRCVLITRKLSGPDFFDLIRQEHQQEGRQKLSYEYHKLHWCLLALRRVQQYSHLGVRHNDIKPDNIVIDVYTVPGSRQERRLDVKLIDLGTASMHHAKEFTGGTSWYESPEQKQVEFYSKKQRDQNAARRVDIGLRSDVWAAGLSVTEVLVGRRVVDTLKAPEGPGPLDFRGAEGWAVEPSDWVAKARAALFSRRHGQWSFCFDAAKFIFDQLVVPEPAKRGTIADALHKIEEQMGLALQRSKRSRRSSDH